ncbi:hypothetical protein F511_40130 [Dorcoceras hygrometricum]|uniref:Uncharacterized protein n=1 Tax=Dorcoceras hygrometricum TaxID=472368 RepID=A0A2Z7CLK0_9LAMI|nr:hypothetical protein F511_40130 [Dorcoceras hygrometricum]
MLAGNTTREVESDTVAEQDLETVKRDFGGLNEGIWPKSSLGHQSCARWTVPEGVALVSCKNMQVGSDVRDDGSAGATEPAGAQRCISCCANVNESDVNVKRNLESAMMTDVKQVMSETAEGWWSLGVLAAAGCGIGSVHEMLAGNTTREVESDTVAEQELKTVKRDFGGLNEGISPKRSLDVREDVSAGATEPAGA